MTSHTIPLLCASCGAAPTEPSRELAFGTEFRCDHCGVTSVLIIDRALMPLGTLQQHGEKVCTACGRVASREARLCQLGHPLVRRCGFPDCRGEYSVDHQRCDFCGRVPTKDVDAQLYRAIVREVVPYGAFVVLQESGKNALLHVAYIPGGSSDALKKGQELDVRILEATEKGVKVSCLGVPTT